MNYRIYLILFLVSAGATFGQPYSDLIGLNGSLMPASSIPAKPDSLKPELRAWQVSATLPLIRRESILLVLTPAYERRELTSTYPGGTSPEAQSPFASRTFSNRTIAATMRLNLKDSIIRLYTIVLGRYFSTFGEGIGAAKATPGIACYAEKRFSNKLLLRLGIYRSDEYYGALWLPLLGWDWTISSRLRTWALLPRNAVVDYKLHKGWHMCLNFRGINESYGIGTGSGDGWLAMQEGHLRLAQEFYIPKSPLVVFADVGISLNREWWGESQVASRDNILKPGENAIFRAGISWRILTDKTFNR